MLDFRRRSGKGVEYQHVDISAQANEAPSARGAPFGESGEYQHVDAFTLTGPSNPPFALWYISSERRPSQIWA